MARPRKRVPVTEADRARLEALLRAGNTPQKIVDRVRIVLLVGTGIDVEEIAERTGFSRNAVYRWRHRYETQGVDGLQDEQRPGRPVELPEKKAREILRRTVHEIPQRQLTGASV
jgi:putative transposase